jgi:hypothetical protein
VNNGIGLECLSIDIKSSSKSTHSASLLSSESTVRSMKSPVGLGKALGVHSVFTALESESRLRLSGTEHIESIDEVGSASRLVSDDMAKSVDDEICRHISVIRINEG